MSSEMARDRAVRQLRKRPSVSSNDTTEKQRKPGQVVFLNKGKTCSPSSYALFDDPNRFELHVFRPFHHMEPTYQLKPRRRFPENAVRKIVTDVFESYLAKHQYEPELCRQMTKTLAEVVKARVRDLMISRYKIVCLVHVGELKDQGVQLGSRCLLDQSYDTFVTVEYRNTSLFAVCVVYGIYSE